MSTLRSVAILFADRNSIYKTLPGCDVYDIDRDARTFPGGMPVVAYPPCRTWGKLACRAKAPLDEHGLALWAIETTRRNGGVVEHPATSRLWCESGIPWLGERDKWGGYAFPLLQWWFGHLAEKATRVYVVGVEPKDLPRFQLRIGEPSHVVSSGYSHGGSRGHGHRSDKPEVNKRERSATPPAFAEWLVEVARRCHVTAP
jgi:hypothetical protein